MPSNPLRRILKRQGDAGGSPEGALEKLERGIQESRQAVRQQNEALARGYFEDSIAALKHSVEESRATLEGLPKRLPGGDEEALEALIGELTQGYASIEAALEEAAGDAPEAEAEEPEGAEAAGEAGAEGEDHATNGAAPAPGAVEGVGGAGEEETAAVVGASEPAAGEEDGAEPPKASDAARRRADDLGVDLSEVEGTGSGGSITVRDVNRLVESPAGDVVDGASELGDDASGGIAAGNGSEGNGQDGGGEGTDGGPRATNAARRRAEELGVDLTSIRGSGANGLITIQDVVKL
ncbi:hypothetical protein GBA65_16135 [Rubrobacter marinus]|uniref:Peripheral subunit-binding (PSBD) domain-containing protein n=1 Tax=Rubrobacter marinus TaxID=2653852 RepID=A0A6G8Q022_9ACTN|nr:E3 binding domain-containing protein [Rubrobacter marinus]QIN79806.1 hypothetical protein GBA65_16135 [Rubrobacter marinus]